MQAEQIEVAIYGTDLDDKTPQPVVIAKLKGAILPWSLTQHCNEENSSHINNMLKEQSETILSIFTALDDPQRNVNLNTIQGEDVLFIESIVVSSLCRKQNLGTTLLTKTIQTLEMQRNGLQVFLYSTPARIDLDDSLKVRCVSTKDDDSLISEHRLTRWFRNHKFNTFTQDASGHFMHLSIQDH